MRNAAASSAARGASAWGLTLYAALFPVTMFAASNAAALMTSLAGLACLPAALARTPRRDAVGRAAWVSLVALLLFGLVSAAWAPAPRESGLLAAKIFGLAAALFVGLRAGDALTAPERERVRTALTFGFGLAAIVAAVLAYRARVLGSGTPVQDLNFSVIAVLFCAPAAAITALRGGSAKRRAATGGALALYAAALGGFASLTAVVAIVLALPAALTAATIRAPRVAGAITAVSAIIASFFSAELGRAALEDRAAPASAVIRAELWEKAEDLAGRQTLRGWGLDSGRRLAPCDIDAARKCPSPRTAGTPILHPLKHPHQVFLQARMDLGLIGLGLLAAAAGLSVAAGQRGRGRGVRGAWAAFAVIAFTVGAFLSGLWQMRLLAMAAGGAMLLNTAARPEERADPREISRS